MLRSPWRTEEAIRRRLGLVLFRARRVSIDERTLFGDLIVKRLRGVDKALET